MREKRLIEWLENKRGKSSMSAFAHRLGLAPSMYSQMVSGKRLPGNKVREAVRRVYPDAPNYIFLPVKGNRCVNGDV